MNLIAIFVLLGTAVAKNSERHSLRYIYTALSKDVGLPGIHKFTAMGMLDNRMIDYFDSETQKKVPKQPWMKERLEQEYWEKGTKSRKDKQKWFEDSIKILKDRMRQNDTGVHVLQGMHGCEGEMQPDGNMTFYRGMYRYSYDGDDFLSFDVTHSFWVAQMREAEETKRKWDDVPVLKEYTKGYLENDCMQWLTAFWEHGKKQLQEASKPEMYVFARDTKVETNILLTCLATGFYPQDIILWIKRDGRELYREDGLLTSGVRPNAVDTFQRRDSVEILRKDKSRYTCEVIHEASGISVKKEWDNSVSGSGGPIIGAAIVGLLVVVVVVVIAVLVVVYRKVIIRDGRRGSQETLNSNSTRSSNEQIEVTVPLNGNSNSNDGLATVTGDNTSDKGSQGSGSSSDSGVSETLKCNSTCSFNEQIEVTVPLIDKNNSNSNDGLATVAGDNTSDKGSQGSGSSGDSGVSGNSARTPSPESGSLLPQTVDE